MFKSFAEDVNYVNPILRQEFMSITILEHGARTPDLCIQYTYIVRF